MIRRFFYHIKRLFEYVFYIFFNRNLKYFHEKVSASITVCKLYVRSIGRKAEKETTTNFFEFKVTGLNAESLLFLFQEIFLSKDYLFECSNRSPRIVDCGSNIGVSILYFKRIFPNSEIIGIEPNPVVFRLLERNIRENKIEGITLLNYCLSDHEGIENFFVEQGGTNNLAGSIFKSRGNRFEVEVKAKRLSSIIKQERFDLIKIDVEGAERQIFSDLSENKLLNCSDKFLIEYHHHPEMKNILPSLLDEFETNGYKYNLRADFRKAGSFQDILVSIGR